MAAEYRLRNLEWSLYTVVFIAVCSLALGYLAKWIARLRGLSEAEQRKVFWGFLFAGPWISGFLIFVAGPAIASLIYSFTQYKLGEEMGWTKSNTFNLDNYRRMMLIEGAHGRRFNQAMMNSFYYALIGVPLQITAALIMALLLNNEVPGIKAFRTIFYLPVILAGGPAILLAWRYMLTSNGGFINVALQKFADTFFVFDYLYRLFIYLMEAFNGFYAGVARGNPIGPFKYTLPAVLIVLFLMTLVRGDWSEGKRVTAWRGAQILGLIVIFRLTSKGLFVKPVNYSWIYFFGLITLIGILYSVTQAAKKKLNLWRVGGLVFAVIILAMVLGYADYDLGSETARGYLLASLVVIGVLAASFFGGWPRAKVLALSAVIILFSLIIFVRAIPGQLDGNNLTVFTHYLTFGSTIEHRNNLDYLDTGYEKSNISSMWIYGLGAAVILGAALLNHRERARRYLLGGSLLFFALFLSCSAKDGVNFFNAFEDIAKATGKPNYHFALFHEAIDQFPGKDRVPLWMTSELWTKPSLILITMWSSGAGMLIFLAALKGVPPSLYEAAEVDGANAMQRFFRITLPMISPAMFYNIVIGMIAALQTFDTVYIMRTTNTEDSLASAAFYLFNRTFRQLAVGEGAAMSWVLVVIILTLTVLQFRYSRSWVHYEA